MKMFCRHCWKKTDPWIGPNAEHIEARCTECGGWIKFLSAHEARELALLNLKAEPSARPTPKRRDARACIQRPRAAAAIAPRSPAIIRPNPS